MPESDKWSRWLIEKRFGGDAEAAATAMHWLSRVRDRVLDNAQLAGGEVLLDVGVGDGLIAFGALDRLGPGGRVICSDISQPLLDHSRSLAERMGVTDRCEFVNAAAEDLRGVAAESVDVVTTRSVLIYVADKAAAFREFYRVLKPGGRISLFEPINNYPVKDESQARFHWFGYDAGPVKDLADRIGEFYGSLQPATDPMLDFDERDLLRHSLATGFGESHLTLEVDFQPPPPQKWETIVDTPGNPLVPSFREVMEQVFTAEEMARFEARVRPQVEAGHGLHRSAVAYLWARKGAPP